MYITTCATSNYCQEVALLLTSIRHSNPQVSVVVHCIDWLPKVRKGFQTEFPSVLFEAVLLEQMVRDEIHTKISRGQKAGCVLRLKPCFHAQTHQKASCGGLWVDADSVVLRPIDSLVEQISKVTFGCTYRPYCDSNIRRYALFATGVLGFSQSDGGRMAIQLYAKRAAVCTGFRDCYYDQIALYEVWSSLQCKIYPMSGNEHSLRGRYETAVVVSRRTSGAQQCEMQTYVESRFDTKVPRLVEEQQVKQWDLRYKKGVENESTKH